jgi:hypothetical protein
MAYLRATNECRQDGRTIVYADETFLHSSHTTPHEWTDGTAGLVEVPLNKGQRLIIANEGEVYQIKMFNPVPNIIIYLII